MERQGVVRVREEVQVELPWHRYTASWQPSPDGPAMSFYSEGGPGWNEIEDAITWARSHAPIVYVRLGQGLSEIYNAGERDGDAQRPTERWPGAPPARAREVHPDYGGVVYVDEEHLVFVPTGRFSAVWGSASGELLEDAEDLFEDLEAAVDWGRRRAAVVLVAELPLSWSHVPTYEIRSAGGGGSAGRSPQAATPEAGTGDDGVVVHDPGNGERNGTGRVQPGARGRVAQGQHRERSGLPGARGAIRLSGPCLRPSPPTLPRTPSRQSHHRSGAGSTSASGSRHPRARAHSSSQSRR